MIAFVPEMLDSYNAGHSVKQVATQFDISTGLMFKLLRDNGCIFRKWRFEKGHKMTTEAIAKSVNTRKGRKLSDSCKAHISEARKCHFDGLNGYGHTKPHCRGYVLAYAPEHTNAHKDGYVMLHTVLMEQHIGRYLKADEVVHHINRIKNDNRIENLQLMNKTEHQRMHMLERRKGGALSIL